jgi:hypothetical protein
MRIGNQRMADFNSDLGWERIRRSRVWCRNFGLPDEWLEQLLHEPTDWAFCIKLAAIAEDAVREALETHIQPNPLAKLATKQPTKDRIDLLVKLNLVENHEADGLRAIAAIRNGYAHSVRNVLQPIAQYLNRDTKDGRTRFDQLANSYEPSPGDTPVSKGWLAESHPRTALWMALVVALSRLYSVRVEASLTLQK